MSVSFPFSIPTFQTYLYCNNISWQPLILQFSFFPLAYRDSHLVQEETDIFLKIEKHLPWSLSFVLDNSSSSPSSSSHFFPQFKKATFWQWLYFLNSFPLNFFLILFYLFFGFRFYNWSYLISNIFRWCLFFWLFAENNLFLEFRLFVFLLFHDLL